MKFFLAILAFFIIFNPNQVHAEELIVPQNFMYTKVDCDPKTGSQTPDLRFYLNWFPVQNAAYYKIYFKQAASQRDYDLAFDVSEPNYTLTVDPKDNYYVAAAAIHVSTGDSPVTTIGPRTQYVYIPAVEKSNLCIPTPTPPPQPTGAPQIIDYFPTELSVKILGQTPLETTKGLFRSVLLEWTGSPGPNVRYFIYSRVEEDAPLGQAGWSTTDTSFAGPTGSMTLSAQYLWYIKVQACKISSPNECISSPSVFLPKYDKAPIIDNTTQQSLPGNLSEKLDEKIQNLEQQVKTIEKKQGFLEEKLNSLTALIQSILSFFKK